MNDCHGSLAYEAGFDTGAANLPVDLSPYSPDDARMFLRGYADAQTSVLEVLTRNLIPHAAAMQEVM